MTQPIHLRSQLDALPVGARVRRTYGANVTIDRKIEDDLWIIDEPERLRGRTVPSRLVWSNGAEVVVLDA